jgi:RNA polymerase sigma-70 factor (ECF subfamily)
MTPTLGGFTSEPSGRRFRRRPARKAGARREIAAPASAIEVAADAGLLRRLHAGDEKAYEELVRSNEGRMLAVARCHLSNEEDARDIVQEAFLLAFRALPQFKSRCRLSTWLHRIVVNAALVKLRSRRRHPEEWIEESLPQFYTECHSLSDMPPADLADAAIEQAELRQLVRRCVARLPGLAQRVVILRDIEELSTEETCEIVGLSQGALRSRLCRARQALETVLEAELATCA